MGKLHGKTAAAF